MGEWNFATLALPSPLRTDRFEFPYAGGDRSFGRQPLNAGSAEESLDAFGMSKDILGILWLGDGTAVA